MTPLEIFLVAALTGLGAFTGILVKAIFAHYENDLAWARKTAERGAVVAEKAVSVAEKVL